MGGRGGSYFTKKDTEGVLQTMRDAGLPPAVSVDEAQKILNSKMKTKEQIPMFSQDTREQYIGEDNIERYK